MGLLAPIIAPFKGFYLCLTDSELRGYALRPWGIGAIIYIIFAYGSFQFYPYLASVFGAKPASWTGIVDALVSFGTAIGMIFVVTILTIGAVLVLGAYYHTKISRSILSRSRALPDEKSVLGEIGRTGVTEFLKLVWLVPLLLITFILGLIPVLTPFAFVLGSLLLSYQFFDYPLDTLHVGAFGRLEFLLGHGLSAILFGATLLVICSIPFAALFIPPVAVAGASWLFTEKKWLSEKGS